ncbi:hypothetical protein VP01_1622g1, partial [Puccinia sorghi]
LSILLKTQTRKTPKSNINVKGGIQSLMMSRTSFMNHIVARGILMISHQVLFLWCKKEVRISGSSLLNLFTHCDGSCQTGRKGAKLPVTSLQESKTKRDIKEGSISNHFNQAEKFDNETLNNIISLPVSMRSLSLLNLWVCHIFGLKRGHAQSQATNSKFTLVHDLWTTKVNRFGFIGSSVSFINNDWNYVFQHISLKLVACNHKGSLLSEPIFNVLENHGLQRKRSSNNNTMAKTMHQKLYNLEGSDFSWDYDTMHIKCFCHKMALVVNAGLNELGLEAPPPPKLKKSFLGSVPYLNTLKPIAEEDDDEDSVDEEESDCDVDSDDVDEGEEDMEEEEDDDDTGKKKDNDDEESNNLTSQQSRKKKTSAANRNKSNKLHELTQNLDFVVKKITGSAAWRQEFKRRADAIEAREVSHSFKKSESGHYQISKQSRKQNRQLLGHFKEIQFTQANWIQIKHLNDELKPFNLLTKEMEGDGPTGAFFFGKLLSNNQRLEEEGGIQGPRECLSSNLSQDDKKTRGILGRGAWIKRTTSAITSGEQVQQARGTPKEDPG